MNVVFVVVQVLFMSVVVQIYLRVIVIVIKILIKAVAVENLALQDVIKHVDQFYRMIIVEFALVIIPRV